MLETIPQNHKAFSNELHRRSSDLQIIKKIMDKETTTLTLLEKLSTITQNELELQDQVLRKKELIRRLSDHTQSAYILNPGKKYHSSKPFAYISRLVGIYHEGTGKMPVCNRGQNYEDEYNGTFYKFLLECKPVLYAIGIDLKEIGTIGKYAYQVVNGYTKKGVKYSSFANIIEYFNSGEFEKL